MTAPKPKRGDIVMVHWEDIQTDTHGNTAEAETSTEETLGFYFGEKTIDNVLQLVTTHNRSPKAKNLYEHSGWDAFPVGAVTSVEIIRRENNGKSS